MLHHHALCLLTTLGLTLLAQAVEYVPLTEGWLFRRAPEKTYERDFQYERMSAWLDDMGRELESRPRPSRRPKREPGVNHPFVRLACPTQDWRSVRLPHDWGVENPFSVDRGTREGLLDMTGAGWYRKTFRTSPAWRRAGRRVFFECDGAAGITMVWLNGTFVGGWPTSYTPWKIDVTDALSETNDNVLAVRVQQFPDANRWYSGAGLCRTCRLGVYPAVHVVPESVRITTPEVSRARATVLVRWRTSDGAAHEDRFTMPKPRLWDVDAPFLYDYVLEGARYRYGIRSIAWTADDGFHLNGRRVQIHGMCLHQDLGPLGVAWNRGAWKRRLEQLKAAGVNAIRMSHERHAAGLYDLCDALGLLVMDECFDSWEMGFVANDYHRLFPDWHERDLRAWLRADRNHPSVVIWSLGNEIAEQRNDVMPGDYARFGELGRRLIALAREEDDTRPYTTANNGPLSCASPQTLFVDVYGFNYRPTQFASFHAAHPEMPMVSTETACLIGTRGEYFFPLDGSWRVYDFHSSSYCLKGILRPEVEWRAQDATPAFAGAFYWTGFDYLGAPGDTDNTRRTALGETPAGTAKWRAEIARYGATRTCAHSCATGMFDLAGFPRDAYWLYLSRFRPDSRFVHLLPHWNWPERVGRKTPVMAFTSADEAELFLNGVSQGRLRRTGVTERFRWNDVVYRPGTLRVETWKNGQPWATETVRTTGPVSRLELVAETPRVAADGESVGYVTVRALDAAGLVVPRSRVPVRIAVGGAGEFVAAVSGDEADLDGFRWTARTVFNGFLSILVRARAGASGPIRVSVTSDVAEGASLEIPL